VGGGGVGLCFGGVERIGSADVLVVIIETSSKNECRAGGNEDCFRQLPSVPSRGWGSQIVRSIHRPRPGDNAAGDICTSGQTITNTEKKVASETYLRFLVLHG